MVKTPLFPTYHSTRKLMQVLDGIEKEKFMKLMNHIREMTGTPQEPVDWTDPDEWILERLDGEEQDFARHIWEKTDHTVNPRHMLGHYYLINGYNLLDVDKTGRFFVTEQGRDFFDQPGGKMEQWLDKQEGLLFILSIVAAKTKGKRGDFLEEWEEYLQNNSNIRSESVIKNSLRRRLLNLADRELIHRDGMVYYAISDKGLTHLRRAAPEFISETDRTLRDATVDLFEVAKKREKQFRRQLLEQLHGMEPFQFENLIKELLIAMGYENVEVTSRASDGGIDVVGEIELGITSVREVIQAKRQKSNVQRPVLDALRGSLYRFQAMRGTIIATSDFSTGTQKEAFASGATPITLINGEKLIDLLIEYGIGVRRRQVEILELDESMLQEQEEIGE